MSLKNARADFGACFGAADNKMHHQADHHQIDIEYYTHGLLPFECVYILYRSQCVVCKNIHFCDTRVWVGVARIT